MQRLVRVSRGQLDVLSVVCGVVGVRLGQVVCAKEAEAKAEAELGLEASPSLTALSQPKIRGSTCAARSQCGARGGDDSPQPAQAMHLLFGTYR